MKRCLVLLMIFCLTGGGEAWAVDVLPCGTSTVVPGEGRWDLSTEDGAAILRSATWMAVLASGQGLNSREASAFSISRKEIQGPTGPCPSLSLEALFQEPACSLILTLCALPKSEALACRVTLKLAKEASQEADPLRVTRLLPVVVSKEEGGGFWAGTRPQDCVILENGRYAYLDFQTRLVEATELSVCNTIQLIHHRESGASWLAGALTQSIGMTGFLSVPDQESFSRWAADCRYRPSKSLSPGAILSSEWILLSFDPQGAFHALEACGDSVRKTLELSGGRVWKGAVPDGWNSWGFYRQSIDEGLILQNLDVAANRLAPYGLQYFQVDDGWEIVRGDWEADPQRFPHGMKWLADRIKEKGLIPGLWISPFWASRESRLFQEHPDWFFKDDPLLDQMAGNMPMLDVTQPEVKDWLRTLFTRMVDEWGLGWIKVDFAYWETLGSRFHEENVTGVEAFRQGMQVINDTVGGRAHLMGVALAGPSMGLVDSIRLNLDVMPRWDAQGSTGNWSVKETAQMLAQRYFLHRKAWIDHTDLLYFRDPLTPNESLAWATAAALAGGNLELGDAFADLSEEEIRIVSRLLPVQGEAARPLDLLEKKIPEIWDLPVQTDWDRWHVIGVFNWGLNQERGKDLLEEPRHHTVDLASLGLDGTRPCVAFEFWTGTSLGEFTGTLNVEVPPRSVKLLCVRQTQDHPQVLSLDRHITQGALFLPEVTWDPAALVLSGTLKARAGVPVTLTLYVPEGFVPKDGNFDADQRLCRISLSPETTGLIPWRAQFERRGGGS